MLHLSKIHRSTNPSRATFASGEVLSVNGDRITAKIPLTAMGDLCFIKRDPASALPAQVIAFYEHRVTLAPFESTQGIGPGSEISNTHSPPTIRVGEGLIGSAVDALGQVLDKSRSDHRLRPVTRSIVQPPVSPLKRAAVDTQLFTGVPIIDNLCGLAYGQRIGLFSPAGLGKTTLLKSIARYAEVDLCVIALVGERTREVHEFLSTCREEDWFKRSIVVVATSNESSIRRKLAATTATTIAEYFRDRGLRVLLLVDSLTRTARAIREVGFGAGEIPVRQGYTSSVFTELPLLLERAGNTEQGSITGVYTVLTSGEQTDDALAEELKSLLDGHWVLSDWALQQGLRPAIDPTLSLSRLTSALYQPTHLDAAADVVRMFKKLKREKDFILMGGTPDKELGAVLKLVPEIRQLLSSPASSDISNLRDTLIHLAGIFREACQFGEPKE